MKLASLYRSFASNPSSSDLVNTLTNYDVGTFLTNFNKHAYIMKKFCLKQAYKIITNYSGTSYYGIYLVICKLHSVNCTLLKTLVIGLSFCRFGL